MMQLTSTTAPGKVFASRADLAEHYKSDWHKYNLKRREAGLPLLREEDFQARLEAALALRREREGREERNGTNHLKNNKKKNKKNSKKKVTTTNETGGGAVVMVSQASAYERIKEGGAAENASERPSEEAVETTTETDSQMAVEEEEEEEEPPVIEPKQSLFDSHIADSLDANLAYMSRKYGFFVPDQEYLADKEGLLGYCHEKIKLGHCCLYCQKLFTTWQGCQKHMISTRHTKLRYERGIDLEEFDPFYDFTAADAEFLGKSAAKGKHEDNGDDGEDEWEDVSDDEEMAEGDVSEANGNADDDEEEDLYAGYEDEIAKYGFDVTPLGELVFPDGRIVGHRGLARYYKQRVPQSNETHAVVAARHAAGERLYRGRVYNVGGGGGGGEAPHESSLALMRAGIAPGTATGRRGKGILVESAGGGYTALSLYRYKAVVKKARRDEAYGQRHQYKTTRNINRMDKKANRLMNGVSVAHAPR